jgi:hypothetical protein
MPTTPREHHNNDTLVTLRDYIESQFASHLQMHAAAKDAVDARLAKSDAVLESRLAMLNELRGDVITKGEYHSGHVALAAELHSEAARFAAEISALKEWRAEQSGKASMAAVYVAYIIGFGGLLMSAVALIHELIGQ